MKKYILSFIERIIFVPIACALVFSPFAFAQETPTSPQVPTLTEEQFNALSDEEKRAVIEARFPNLSRGGSSTPSVQPSAPEAPQNTVNCFDYYHFGSVQVDVSPTLSQTIPGIPLTFVGKIKNSNPYPITDGQVYAKIFLKEEGRDDGLTHQNGYPAVDFFLAKDNVDILAQTEEDITFDWKVPYGTRGGDYEIAFYFTSAYRFNLLGLSFTDDVTGNKASFRITDDINTPVTFNKDTVKLNNTIFRFAAFPPHFTKDESVTVYTDVTNPHNEEHTVEVTYVTSKWDAILDTNEAKRETVSVTLKPKETKTLSYTPPILNTSVTFIQTTLKDGDTESVLGIRFVRDGNEEIRINFPSVTSWPLKAGEEATIFSCLHSTNLPVVPNNTLTLTLKDHNGTVIHSYTYEGDVTGNMMGVKDSFIPEKDINSLSLTATLTHNGAVVDEVTMRYFCSELDPVLCPQEPLPTPPPVPSRVPMYILIGLTLFALVVLTGLFLYKRRIKANEPFMHTPE